MHFCLSPEVNLAKNVQPVLDNMLLEDREAEKYDGMEDSLLFDLVESKKLVYAFQDEASPFESSRLLLHRFGGEVPI